MHITRFKLYASTCKLMLLNQSKIYAASPFSKRQRQVFSPPSADT